VGKIMSKNILRIAIFLIVSLCAVVSAQPQNFSDPLKLARIALGDEQGSVALGIAQGSTSQFAFLNRTGKEIAVVTLADGAPISSPPHAAEQQLFEIGSITKVFTGLLLAQAVEKGDVSLDDSLGKLLAGTVNFQSSATAAITLRQLITHSSCLPRSPLGMKASLYPANPYGNFTRSDLWAELSSMKLASSPPCAAVYSNLGIALVGEILSHRYNKPWIDLVKTQITEPLGMKDTVQSLGDKAHRFAQGFNNQAKAPGWEFEAIAGAGALRSTVSDMLIFSRALMAGNSGPLGAAGQRLLQPLGKFQSAQIGYAIFIRGSEGKRAYLHDGLTGGYRAEWIITPSTQEAVIALTGNSHSPVTRMRSLLMAGIYPLSTQPSQAPVTSINDYAGAYRIDQSSTVSFVVQNAQLYRRFTGGGYRALVPAGTDTFVDVEFGVQYTFNRSSTSVASLSYSQGGSEFTAEKTGESPHSQAIADPDKAKEYVGRYLLERGLRNNIDFDVKEEGGQLLVRSSNWPRQPVFPKRGQNDRFFYDAPNIELQFERNEQGKIIALTLFEKGTYKMMRVPD
jgi:serine-type D-Ala-D-Ala carboxypeptidase/endopeptidase